MRARAGRLGRLCHPGGRRCRSRREDCGDGAHGERRTELIAGKRFIVVRSILDEFEKALVEAMSGFEMADPTRDDTKLGPMVSVRARDDIHAQVTRSVEKGARLLLGGKVPTNRGPGIRATVLADVRPGQPVHDEEVFGPVAAIIAAEDEADAIKNWKYSEFGLGSGVLTSDIDRGRRSRRKSSKPA